MKLVIEIPEEDYNNIEPFLNGETIKGGINLFKALEIIKNGKLLPKGHGNLVDADYITQDLETFEKSFYRYDHMLSSPTIICEAPVIVEADKEDQNERL